MARHRRHRGFLGRVLAGGSAASATRWAFWGLWALVPLSALAIGSIPIGFTVAATLLAASIACLAAYGHASRRGAPLLPVMLLASLALFTLLQSIPLPIGLLSKLDPAAADAWSRSLIAVRGQVSWGALSLNPSATSVEAAKWAGYACVFFAASTLARSHGLRACLQIVVFATVLVALVTIAHQLLDLKRVFGIYQPRSLFTGRIGPLLNTNHLAGYLNLGALCAVGLALSPYSSGARWIFATAAIIDVGASLRAASRGGAGALFIGLLLLGILIAIPSTRAREGDDRGRRFAGLTMIGVTAAIGVGLAALGFDRALWLELASPDTGKLRMATWFKPMVVDYFPSGIGRGAFETAFEAYRPSVSGNTVFTHPENIIAQWVTEWGLIGVVGLLAFAWVFRPWRLGLLRSPKNAGAFCAVIALLIHNLADFSLEIPGVAIAFAVVLGALWGNVRTKQAPNAVGKSRLAPVLGLAALAVLGCMLAVTRGTPALPFARDEVRQTVIAAKDGKVSLDVAREQIVANMRRFPAEYYFPQAGADLAFHAGEDPIPWLQRALERGPSIGLTHFILAEYLASRGARAQSFLELRLAAEYENFLQLPVATTALSWGRNDDDLMRAVPDGTLGVGVLEAMSRQTKNPTYSAAFDHEILARDPAHRPARMRTLDRLLGEMKSDACPDLSACEVEVTESAQALRDYYPQSSVGDQYLAKAAILNDDPKRALTLLRDGCTKPQDVSDCVRLQATVEEPAQLPHVLERFVNANCRTNEACAEAYTWVAKFQADKLSWASAYDAAEKAARKAPNEARWTLVADYAEKAGLHREAVQALQQIVKSRGLDPLLSKRIDENRMLTQ